MKKRDAQCLIFFFFQASKGKKLLGNFSCGVIFVKNNGTWKLVEKSGGKRGEIICYCKAHCSEKAFLQV